ncbi:uracil-5--methyltransferase [Plectosphaerella plurivora]|uniref:tRNA (uracil(54)-C(5))-methyltransferase n=1 Tax=Plectosphaerella plurivora TaxID=936078 RepID=A0A9P9ACU6_9PEZI|nr:uracil-5--methyltransferase [Plectosphaerella plurivora]
MATSEPQSAPAPQAAPEAPRVTAKRPFVPTARMAKKLKSKRERSMTEGTIEEVLLADVSTLVKSRRGSSSKAEDSDAVSEPLPESGTYINVEVLELSSTGDGLGVQQGSTSPQIYVAPFVVPGDVARVKVFKHFPGDGYTMCDYDSIITPSTLRDDARISCKYFTKCSGCQFQMLDYNEQLRHKKSIVVKAYQNFSQLPPNLVPDILDTMGSPLQYGYRTKLTPHFDGPPGNPRKKNLRKPFEKVPTIGFNEKGRRNVLDIEDCPIGTNAVRLGMKRERERMTREFGNYKSGATILLRESTNRYPKDGPEQPPAAEDLAEDVVRIDAEEYVDIKTCTTDNKAMTSEYIDNFVFTNPAGSFFQNNNSILSPFTGYVRDLILPPAPDPSAKPVSYLIDAYSGSGLFTITLSGMFKSSQGIDIAADSIASARDNARLNNIPEDECSFIAADAPQLFKHVAYDADETVVVLDPPRKGCDASFLGQLLQFGPRRVIYVSCNVHTQARDVGVLVRGEVEGWKPEEGAPSGKKTRYDIESIRGFDFFPQTGHVEGVAVLNRVEE